MERQINTIKAERVRYLDRTFSFSETLPVCKLYPFTDYLAIISTSDREAEYITMTVCQMPINPETIMLFIGKIDPHIIEMGIEKAGTRQTYCAYQVLLNVCEKMSDDLYVIIQVSS
jgi:hypothetical protein